MTEFFDNSLGAALHYAARGWPVLPLHAGGKTPRTTRGYLDATTDERVIRSWWQQAPDANIGITTGHRSGLVVLDVDNGGEQSLRDIEVAAGPLPPAPMALTGGGGRHLLFRAPAAPVATRVRFRPGLDVKADGGYIVAPPSRHPSGEVYRWTEWPLTVDPPPCPAWLIAPPAATRARSPDGIGGPIGEGRRNVFLASIAGTLHNNWLDIWRLTETLRAINESACDPPLGEAEVDAIARSISRYLR